MLRRRRVANCPPGRRPTAVALLLVVGLAAGCASRQPAAAPAAPTPAGTPSATTAAPPSATPSAQPSTPTPVRSDLRYVFPVIGNVAYHPTHSGYRATDIFADCGSPVVAVTDGTILEVSLIDRFDENGPRGPFNGGKSVSLLGDDGVRYYGSHLSAVTAGVAAGVRVRAGQSLGKVGRTGNANNVCHLHFGISPPCQRTADWWIRRGEIWPASFLDAWRNNVNRSPADTVSAWQRANGCPKPPQTS